MYRELYGRQRVVSSLLGACLGVEKGLELSPSDYLHQSFLGKRDVGIPLQNYVLLLGKWGKAKSFSPICFISIAFSSKECICQNDIFQGSIFCYPSLGSHISWHLQQFFFSCSKRPLTSKTFTRKLKPDFFFSTGFPQRITFKYLALLKCLILSDHFKIVFYVVRMSCLLFYFYFLYPRTFYPQ